MHWEAGGQCYRHRTEVAEGDDTCTGKLGTDVVGIGIGIGQRSWRAMIHSGILKTVGKNP